MRPTASAGRATTLAIPPNRTGASTPSARRTRAIRTRSMRANVPPAVRSTWSAPRSRSRAVSAAPSVDLPQKAAPAPPARQASRPASFARANASPTTGGLDCAATAAPTTRPSTRAQRSPTARIRAPAPSAVAVPSPSRARLTRDVATPPTLSWARSSASRPLPHPRSTPQVVYQASAG